MKILKVFSKIDDSLIISCHWMRSLHSETCYQLIFAMDINLQRQHVVLHTCPTKFQPSPNKHVQCNLYTHIPWALHIAHSPRLFFFEGCSSGKQGEGTQEQPWHRGTRLPHGEAKHTACTQQQLLFITVDIGAALHSGWGPVALGSVYTHNEAV